MKKLVIAAALTVATAGMAMAEPVAGTWKTEPGDTGGYLHVKIAPCGSAICGTISKAFDADGAAVADYEHAGKRMIWDMNADGGGKYSGGKIWAADSDKTYNSKMTLSGNKLNVKGCVAVICRGQDWKRVN
ncbi:MAG: DUF2147 domain-containing protein [Shimia sp.]|jgi:uncharacterized protein (DUF2147 family)|uniref:DUF2147 domain-containing protein n=1 Tax=Shimia sp. TaxID=1954381 RepID=UPI004059A881